MAEGDWLEKSFDALAKDLKIGKVYLETHRSRVTNDRETMLKAKRFFESRGIRTAGGHHARRRRGPRVQAVQLHEPGRPQARRGGGALHGGPLRRADPRRLLLHHDEDRERHPGEGRAELERVPPRPDEGGRAEPGRRAGEGGQPEGQGRDQVPELVRALPLRGLQPRGRAADLRRDLHRHRDARPRAHAPAPAGATRATRSCGTSRTSKPGGNGGGWVDPFARDHPRPLRRADRPDRAREGARDHALLLLGPARARSASPTAR